MMDELKTQLIKRDFRLNVEDEKTILVKLGFGLSCRIKSNEENQVVINGHLQGWNFATGLVNVNMKWLMAYNAALLFLVLGVIMYLQEEPFSSPFFYDFFFAWFILSNIYYIIKFHYFKLLAYGLVK